MARRGNGEGTIRKRVDGTWEARFTVGKNEDGRPITRSLYARTRKEVAEKLNQALNDLGKGLYVSPDKLTVNEWIADWLNRYLINAKNSTRQQYELYLRLYVKPAIGNVKLQSVSFVAIKNIILDSSTKLSPKSVHNLHGILHHLFADAKKVKLIKDNPTEGQDLPKIKKQEMVFLEGDTRKAFCEEIRGKLYEHLFFVALFTGARQGELLGLTWSSVDFQRRTLTISQQLKRNRVIGEKVSYVIDSTKTDNVRTISPAPIVFDVLRKVKKEQAQNKLMYGNDFNNEDDLVFTNEHGHHLVSVYVLKVFKQRAAAIGLPDLRFHDLRHSHVVMRAEMGDDIKSVSLDLGHSDIRTTAEIYAHVSQRMKEDSAKRMQSLAESLYAT